MSATDARIAELYAARPRNPLLLWSGVGAFVLVVVSWVMADLDVGAFFEARRLENLERFLGRITPHGPGDAHLPPGAWPAWARDLIVAHGAEAMGVTLAISVAAIVLAAGASLVFSLLAARNVATSEPFLPGSRPASPVMRLGWRSISGATRVALVLLRSIPEYIWAYLLIGMLGISAWPAVLALAIHNAGILGKLNSEVIENLEPRRLAALRSVGASRLQIAAVGLYPGALSRLLLYLFYRWETCVREATVLGMLGIVSLGRLITDARVRRLYDEMLLYVLLGAVLVVAGDLISALARAMVRRAR
ncbi:MAG: ABC transporter permease subunit [Deltaproteobacteria bacterium]|jgi:phosphonate transport system permease protein|nr:ABC transporter permease subunit [Deltaproteobacteria bacterium]